MRGHLVAIGSSGKVELVVVHFSIATRHAADSNTHSVIGQLFF
jgi:hypothetical protein